MNPVPNADPDQKPTTPEKASQLEEHALPTTQPSITGSIDELGERLETKNGVDETDDLPATEEPA